MVPISCTTNITRGDEEVSVIKRIQILNGEEHDVKFCDTCLVLVAVNGLECPACAPEIIPLMLDEIAKQKEELTRLRKENEELRESAK